MLALKLHEIIMKTVIITDLKKLVLAIDSIKKRSSILDRDIQTAAMSAVDHFGKCGDVGYINRLYLALGKGARHVAFIEWITQFGGVMANEGEGKETTPFIKDKNKVVDLEGGDGMPWYECKPSPKPDEVLDYYALLMKVVTKKAKAGQEVKNAALMLRVADTLKAYDDEVKAGASHEGIDETVEETEGN
jgi:hypothetical protein